MCQYIVRSCITHKKTIQRIVDELDSVWWFTEVHRDINALIRRYDGPVRTLVGSRDLLASSSTEEVQTRHLLRHSPSEAFTFKGLNHLF